MALLSAVQRVSVLGISIVSLQNEGFPTVCLCLTLGRHLGVTENSDANYRIWKEDSCPRIPPRAILQRPSCYRCNLMFNAVCDINYITESDTLGDGKQLGGEIILFPLLIFGLSVAQQ